MISKPIKVKTLDSGRKVTLFFHHSNDGVTARITTDPYCGSIDSIRKGNGEWVTLTDDLNRAILWSGCSNKHVNLSFNLEEEYLKYAREAILGEENEPKARWTKTTKPLDVQTPG